MVYGNFFSFQIRYFLIGSVIFSVSLNVVKIFNHILNQDYPYLSHPFTFNSRPAYKLLFNLAILYLAFDFLSSLVFGVVLVIIQLIVDLALMIQLRRTLSNKNAANLGLSKTQKKTQKENSHKASQRALVMVIVNASINIFIKSFILLDPIYKMVTFHYHSGKRSYKNGILRLLFDYGLLDLSSNTFYTLYLTTLAMTLFFFYNFDKSFKACFLKIFSRKNSE